MTIHAEIQQSIRAVIGDFNEAGVADALPSSVALATYERYRSDSDDAHVRYASVEHFKQMARSILARTADPNDGRESVAYQGDMFSGHLQERYPLPRPESDDPVYRRRELLSIDELDWNIAQPRKSADSRARHADALAAYRDQKASAAA